MVDFKESEGNVLFTAKFKVSYFAAKKFSTRKLSIIKENSKMKN